MADIGKRFLALSLHKDGIWYGNLSDPVSYPQNAHDDFFGIEEQSYWFLHRNDCINALIETFPPGNEKTIFDIGGGNGVVSYGLIRRGFDVILIEPGARGARNARSRGIQQVICSTLEMTGGGPSSICNAGLFDVLEHVENDLSFLCTIANMMERDGRLYLTVPSFPTLWSREDVDAGHFRRYRKKHLLAKLEAAGFTVLFSSAIFRMMPIPIFLSRTIPTVFGFYRSSIELTREAHTLPEGILGCIMRRFLRSEVEGIYKKIPIEVGSSYIVAAKLREDERSF